MEAALQTLYHMHLIDSCQRLTKMYGVLVFALELWFQEFDGTVPCILQMHGIRRVCQVGQCIEETLTCIFIHCIFEDIWRKNIREYNMLALEILPIVRVVEDVMTCPSHRNLINHFLTNNIVDLINF